MHTVHQIKTQNIKTISNLEYSLEGLMLKLQNSGEDSSWFLSNRASGSQGSCLHSCLQIKTDQLMGEQLWRVQGPGLGVGGETLSFPS